MTLSGSGPVWLWEVAEAIYCCLLRARGTREGNKRCWGLHSHPGQNLKAERGLADAFLTAHHLCPALQRPAVWPPELVMEEQGRWRTGFIHSRADKEAVG